MLSVDIIPPRKVQKSMLNFLETLRIVVLNNVNLRKHLFSTFSIHSPPLQVRTSLPTSLNPSWQIYLALDRPMFIAILVLFGGFLRSPRSRSLHRLSFPATKKEL